MERSFPWQLVTVDIDGTLTRTHGWREIAVAFDQLREYDETNRLFRARKIDEDRHLENLLNEVTGHTVAEVLSVVERTPKLKGISSGLARLHELGATTALLTHNPSYVADWYRRTYGFDDAEGVDSQRIVDGRIGPPEGTRADKPAGMRALLDRHEVPPAAAVHIGDSWSDAVVFRLVGGGLALNSPLPEVNHAADIALRTDDFRDVVLALTRLTPRG